jgi:hypothetical protein
MSIVSRQEPDLGHVDRVMTVLVAQQLGCGRREHLIDEEGCHASSISRCPVVLRLRYAIARRWSVLALIALECSAA